MAGHPGKRGVGVEGVGIHKKFAGRVRGGSGGCLGEDNTRIHAEGMIEG